MMAYKGWGVRQPAVTPKCQVDLMEEGGLAHSGGDEVLPRVEKRKAESERYASRQDKLASGSAGLMQAAVF